MSEEVEETKYMKHKESRIEDSGAWKNSTMYWKTPDMRPAAVLLADALGIYSQSRAAPTPSMSGLFGALLKAFTENPVKVVHALRSVITGLEEDSQLSDEEIAQRMAAINEKFSE